jgi:hypothetical protein
MELGLFNERTKVSFFFEGKNALERKVMSASVKFQLGQRLQYDRPNVVLVDTPTPPPQKK